MKTKLSKVFGTEGSLKQSIEESATVKIEDLNITEEVLEEDVYCGNYRYNKPYRGVQRGFRGNQSRGRLFAGNQSSGMQTGRRLSRGRVYSQYLDQKYKKQRCSFCESLYHTYSECPERIYFAQEEEGEEHDVVLYQSNLICERDFNIFVAESSVSAILDCGASATVSGKGWFDSYVNGLSAEQQSKVQIFDSQSSFKFGTGESFKSCFKAKIPARIGSKSISIMTDVVDTNIPLLLSKDSMKSAKTEINFVTDEVKMFGETQNVHFTKSGHYALPLNGAKGILDGLDRLNCKINLFTEGLDKKKIAVKLHSQFGHPSKIRLMKLLKRAGRDGDLELIEKIEEVYKECDICKAYAKPEPVPKVGFPLADEFNETVAMDLKFFDGKIILHLVDHLTRFSTGIICKSKEPKEIVSAIIRSWVSIFGPPRKFLMDNGGEFANETMIEFAESMNIRILTTAAESPWSNGLVERHNATLAEILHKVLAENKVDLETALAWAINAKNSLSNVHGFSPVQLALGYNPQLPNILSNKPPANSEVDHKDVLRKHLNTMKSAREAFIQSESSERIKRALKHNVYPSSANKFYTGDQVLYKRKDSRRWKGPGKVIGYESSNILIKHGSQYVRVHISRVRLIERSNDVNPTEAGSKSATLNINSSEDTELDRRPSGEFEGERQRIDEDDDQEQTKEETGDHEQSLGEDDESETSVDRSDDADETVEQTEDAMNNVVCKDDVKELEIKLKKGLVIDYEVADEPKQKGVLVKRTGKATGKYKNFWYVKNLSTGEVNEYDFDQLKSWKKSESVESDVNFTYDVWRVDKDLEKENTEKVSQAKMVEIEKWKEQNVYEEVKDEGQNRISTTWVVTEKKQGGQTSIKARLVARGYEEQEKVRSDSPTCSKDNVRLCLTVAAAKNWEIRSLDIKSAFLQGGAIERELCVVPPKEFRKSNVLWRLKKAVYGLTDASRSWYLEVIEVLRSLNMKLSQYDKAVALYHEGDDLNGMIIIHVDDLLYFGSESFLRSVMEPFKAKFQISREEAGAFKYVGISVKQAKDHIILDQNEYLGSVNGELLSRDVLKEKERYANEDEKKIFKQGVGQLGWLSGISKPEASFMYCTLSTIQSKPQMKDFSTLTKAFRDLKASNSEIKINELDLSSVKVTAYSDASFGTLPGGASQLGYIILLRDDNDKIVPITWISKKARRVARSTLSAETLAAVEALDAAFVVKAMVEEILPVNLPPIDLYVDNKSLHDAAKTTNTLVEKRLLVDISAIREMLERKEINIFWTPTESQLADVLTKGGVDKAKLTATLASGFLSPNM